MLWRRAAALLAGAALSAAAHAAPAAKSAPELAPDLSLRLVHTSFSIGADGVTRESRYSDRMVRRGTVVWLERELPPALAEHAAPQHSGPHAGHAHEEANGAPLIVRRVGDEVQVQIVLRERKRVIDVEPAHQGNVGYGGSWPTAYWLIDPGALVRMERLGRQGDVERYRLRSAERVVLVDWDVRGQYARRIQQRDVHGLSRQELVAEKLPLPARAPWEALDGYGRGDYSDLLD
ncbi:hypothetical protein [Rubrivivax gelatinosus]|uniref:hypothetical protein n=1 Tax=Rubrivivax gelatinosus TaxID=28068 RepID=UPI0002E68234|nr:hypothetical protein [Rubrivivax gelatinosus]